MSEVFNVDIKITDNSNLALRLLNDACENALNACGYQAETFAALNLEKSPRRIDTGLLRNSITHALDGEEAVVDEYEADKPKGNAEKVYGGSYSGEAPKAADGTRTVYIGTNVEYAIYVHNGTSKMAPNRFLKKAVTEHKKEYKAIIEKQLKDG